MLRGKVKWFNAKKGYGFIQTQGSSEDIFAHYSNICSDGFRVLVEGQEVEFDVVRDAKGLKAKDINLISVNHHQG